MTEYLKETALKCRKDEDRSYECKRANAASEELAMRFINIAVSLSAEKDLQKLMNLITSEAIEFSGSDKGTLYLIDHQNRKLMFYVTDQKSYSETFVPLTHESISGYVGITGNPLVLDDVYDLPPESPYKFNRSFDQSSGFRTKSMLVVPLFSHKNEILGVIQLINKKSGGEIVSFSPEDLKVIQAVGALAAVSIENTLLYREIENLFESFVKYSATAIDERDPCTGGHSRRVAMYSLKLAESLGKFTEGQLKELSYASWLHDLGKIGVREAVLNKAFKLTAPELDALKNRFLAIAEKASNDSFNKIFAAIEKGASIGSPDVIEMKKAAETFKLEIEDDYKFIEQINIPGFLSDDKAKRLDGIKSKKYIDASGKTWEYITAEEYENLKVIKGNLTVRERGEMESHALKTYDILKHIPFTRELKNVAEIAARHHEKLDGSGYPYKLSGGDVPIQARIIAISDMYDALVSQDRPYKKAMPPEVALKILNEEAAAGKLDRDILNVFIEKGVYKTQ